MVLKSDWVELLKSGKEVYVTFKSDEQEDGLDGISGVLKSFNEDLQSFILDIGEDDIHGFTFDEVVDVELCEDIEAARPPLDITFLQGGKVRFEGPKVESPDGTNTSQLVIEDRWKKVLIITEAGHEIRYLAPSAIFKD